MSKTPNYDAKVKKILDEIKPGERTCALTGETWMMSEEEISWYRKFSMPPSNISPLMRMKWLCSFFTMYQFWYQTHPETGKQFVTLVHPMSELQAIPDEEWFARDFSDTFQDWDSNKSFFEQFRSLQVRVSFPATKFIKKPENSIALASLGDVNSYFMMASRSRDSFYSSDVDGVEDSCDISCGSSVTGSYHVSQSHRIHNSQFIDSCYDCLNSAFLFDCKNCENCFGATNKRNAKYIWWNEQLSKEEWESRRNAVDLSCRSQLKELKEKFNALIENDSVWPEYFGENCTNTIGEYVSNAVDCKYIYSGQDGPYKDMYYITYLFGNCYDCAFSGAIVSSNNCFHTNTAVNSSNVHFSHMVVDSQNVEYSLFCYNCENCFGCVGLRHKKFCIFNKQYTEEEYWQKLDEIKCKMLDQDEYGKFFPSSFNLGYFYDAGSAVVYLADESDAKMLEVPTWGPEEGGAVPKVDYNELTHSSELPDCIDDVGDEWVNKPLYDEGFGRRYSIIKPELDWYKKHRIAAPDEHFVKRVYDLFREANTAIFEETQCHKCSTTIVSAKSKRFPNRKIYCRSCYLAFIEETN